MSSATVITIVVIAVVALLLIAAVAILGTRRRRARRRQEAAQMRGRAAEHVGAIRDSRVEAATAQSRADVARTEAERAEQEAAEARRALDMERARQEDELRKADAIDPDVDHRADGYEPGTGTHRKT